MAISVKMTRQGVRDLDFGWKKKVVVAPHPEPANTTSPESPPSPVPPGELGILDGGSLVPPPAPPLPL